MPEILLELLSEEIPARMQKKASDDLLSLVTNHCVEAGLTYTDAACFSTPRRLTLILTNVAEQTLPKQEERKGPRVNAPDKAIDGFVNSTGLKRSDLKVQSDAKGDFYVAVIKTPAQLVDDVLATVIPNVIRDFPWPKSMRWGIGSLRWVRPLHSILCVKTGKDGVSNVIPLNIEGIQSGNRSQGHRVHSQKDIIVSSGGYEAYVEALHQNYVILDPEQRKDTIRADASSVAFAQGCEVVEDEALLAEIAGLVEWPVVLMGEIPEEFLALPPEVLQTSMREHQKFLSVKNMKTGRIEKFITAANIQAGDGGKKILAGNQRVLRARLSDAKFFWENDLNTPLDKMQKSLEKVTFHNKLGSQKDRIARIEQNAAMIAPLIGADVEQAERAAQVCKADLCSQMVFEFPELQGTMGKYYAQHAGEAEPVARACSEHYKPLGPSDTTPSDLVCVAVSLADKVDLLSGFWSIDEKPTGSKDPFALRRAALGVIRLILENGIHCDLNQILSNAFKLHAAGAGDAQESLVHFILERLKVYLRDKNIRHDVIDACLDQDIVANYLDIRLFVQRVEAVSAMIHTAHGKEFLAMTKRVVNILKAEEDKDGVEYTLDPDSKFFETEQEKTLLDQVQTARPEFSKAFKAYDFEQSIQALFVLKDPLNQFFDAVIVNSDNSIVRRNRLCLLNTVRQLTQKIANLEKISD